MAIRNSKKVTPIPNVYIKGGSALKDAVIEFADVNTAPTTATGYRYLYSESGVLKFDDGSTTYNLLTSAGGGISSWDGLYASDTALTIDGATLTFAGTHATNDVFTVTGAGTGAAIEITNSSTGADINGTGGTWNVSKAGAAVFTAITGCDDITAAASLTLEATAGGTISIGATSSGAIDIGTGTGIVTVGSTLVITGGADADAFTITDGDVLVTAGQVTIAEDDTTTYALNITSDGTTGGAIHITANALAEGMAVVIDSDNGASFGAAGGYLAAYNGSENVFSVARYGAVTIAGVNGGDVLTLTAGDFVVTSGSITITADDDNDATLSVTNDTATTASVIALAGSGVFTGTTTASWMTVTPSGLTTGTGVYAVGAGLTQGKLMHLSTDATMTTGNVLYVQNTGASSAMTSGRAATFDHTATGVAAAVNKTGSVVSITSNRTVVTGGTTADDFDCLSVVKATTRTATGTATTAGSAIYVEVQSTGTVTETSNGVEIVMDSGGTGSGISLTHSAATAKGIVVTNNSVTTGMGINIASSTTTLATTGRLFASVHSGNASTSGVLNEFSSAAADESTILRVTASAALALGVALDVSVAALTTGKAIDVSNLDALTTGTGLHIDATGNTQTTGKLIHIDSASTVIETTGRLFLSAHTGNASTTAVLNEFSTASAADEQLLRLTASAALAAGVILDISAAAATTATLIDMQGLAAITTGKAIHIDADGVTQTHGILVHIDSASTALTSTGRLLLVDHTGNATVSGVIAEIKSVAADETVLLKLNGAAITSGVLCDINPTAVTTGNALRIEGADALTSGDLVSLESDSADVSARALLKMHNNNTAATGVVPLEIIQDAPTSTNYKKIASFAGVSLWISDGTTPNGNLSGTAGDVCFNGASSQIFFCTGTTSWTSTV